LAKAESLVCPLWSEIDHFRLEAEWSLSADFVVKMFFALLIKNSLGSRRDLGINM
jgi:hypothetical protein